MEKWPDFDPPIYNVWKQQTSEPMFRRNSDCNRVMPRTVSAWLTVRTHVPAQLGLQPQRQTADR